MAYEKYYAAATPFVLFQHFHRSGENVWRFSTVLRREQRYPEGGDPLKLLRGRSRYRELNTRPKDSYMSVYYSLFNMLY